jgi:hypothetical protein
LRLAASCAGVFEEALQTRYKPNEKTLDLRVIEATST